MIDIEKIRKAEISQDGKDVNLEGMPLLSTLISTNRKGGGMAMFLHSVENRYLDKLEEYEQLQEKRYRKKKDEDNIALDVEGKEWLIDVDLLACTIYRKMFETGKVTLEFSYDELAEGPLHFRALLITEYGFRQGIFSEFDLGTDGWADTGTITLKVNQELLLKYNEIIAQNPKENIINSKLVKIAGNVMFENLK